MYMDEDFFKEVKVSNEDYTPTESEGLWDGCSVLELEEFIECCKTTCFIDYDGYGYYSNSKEISEDCNEPEELKVWPSEICDGKINYNYKYVHWYNR